MNASRILSVAAVAAFASFGAQANDLYGTNFEAQFQPSRDRAAVQAEAVQAVPHFKNFVAPASLDRAPAPATVSRASVRAEAVTAARAGAIALGDRS